MDSEIKNKMRYLITKIKQLEHDIHITGNQPVSDEIYNYYRKELETMEKDYGILSDSPSLYVGKNTSNITVKRKIPMLSLRHTYNDKDLITFCDQIVKQKRDFIIEPKIDGVAISVIYTEEGLQSISLRGNGYEGEDVSKFKYYINGLPLDIKENMEVRGECYLPLSDNTANRRNFVAGYLRKKTPNPSSVRFCAYKLIGSNYETEAMEKLSFMGFETVPYLRAINSQQAIEASKSIWHQTFNFEIDGAVIKCNDTKFGESLGFTERYCRDAIAYKFSANGKETKILNIIWNISSNGSLIPIAELFPIVLGGATISKCHCHNKRYLKVNGIGEGSKVIIIRVGHTIPAITQVIEPTGFNPISLCPFCSCKIEETNLHYVCKNSNCKAILFIRIKTFFKKLEIKYLADHILDRILMNVKENDFFLALKEVIEILNSGKWIENKNDRKAFENFIKTKKNLSISNVLISISIPNVGKSVLKDWESIDMNFISNFNGKRGFVLRDFFSRHKQDVEDIYYMLSC